MNKKTLSVILFSFIFLGIFGLTTVCGYAEEVQLSDGIHSTGEYYGFWYNSGLNSSIDSGAYITTKTNTLNDKFNFNGRTNAVLINNTSSLPSGETGVDAFYTYDYSYYVGKVKVSDITDLRIYGTLNEYGKTGDWIRVHFKNVGPDYSSSTPFNADFLSMMSASGIKQQNASLLFQRDAASTTATTYSYRLTKDTAVMTDNSDTDANNVVSVKTGSDVTLSKLRDTANGYTDSEGYVYIYVEGRYYSSINVAYTESADHGKTGVYLDGSQAESYDEAMNTAIADTENGEHTIGVYSDVNTSQISWLRYNPITLNVKNSDETVSVKANNGSSMLRIGASGSTVNLGRSDLTETNDEQALVFDAQQKGGRNIEMQPENNNGTLNIYNGVVLTGAVNVNGGSIENKYGTTNIYGGKITGNTATEAGGGGAICILGGTVNMSGGLISNNTSKSYKGGGIWLSNKAQGFHMSGGEVKNNTGYDVYVSNQKFYMSGSAYAGNVYLEGSNVINVEGAFSNDRVHAMIKPESYETGKAVVTYASGLTPNTDDFFVISDSEQAYTLKVQGQNLVLEPCERTYIETLYLTACTYPTYEEGADYIKNALSINYKDGETKIDLPTANEENDGFSLSWSSSDEGVVTSDGVVTIPEIGKKSVDLTANITFKGVSVSRKINVVIDGRDPYDFNLKVGQDKGVDIPNELYGLFFEDINFAADGGIYAEMVENRSFESIKVKTGFTTEFDGLNEWSSNGTMNLKDSGGLNVNNPHYLEFTGTSFQNSAYDGIYTEAGKTYTVSFWAKADNYSGSVSVSAGNNSVIVANNLTNEWTKYTATLVAEVDTRKVPLVVTLSENGTVDFDMISMMPDDAVDGIYRRDLVEKLKAMKPGFLRFPGGCIVEGGSIENLYDWKKSIGPIEERVQNWNKWGSAGGNSSNYNQTLGLGYYEYFELCEYLDCMPMPIQNVGLACQNIYPDITDQRYLLDSEEFKQLVQDTLDLIEFANGDADTTWGSIRAQMGHPEPFNLQMIGIGNEQWDDSRSQYYERYKIFENAIHDVYPDMKLIACSMRDKTKVWDWAKKQEQSNPNYIYALDEHTYATANWFYDNTENFDSYDRNTNIKVFFGEFAASRSSRVTRVNCLDTALSVAAYMTGIERNADIVQMASYAPLFSRNGYTQWITNMIYFDDKSSFGSPEYYVQTLFANNMGAYTIKSDLEKVGTTDMTYQTVSYDENTNDIILKLVNGNTTDQVTEIDIDGKWGVSSNANAKLYVMTADDLNAVNSIDNPENIAPVQSSMTVSSNFRYAIPAQSVVVMRIPTKAAEPTSTPSATPTPDGKYDGSIELTVDGSSITGKFDIEYNNTDKTFNAYIAVYNQDGALVSCITDELSSGSKVINASVPDNQKYTCKAFLWDNDNKPVCNAVSKNIN